MEARAAEQRRMLHLILEEASWNQRFTSSMPREGCSRVRRFPTCSRLREHVGALRAALRWFCHLWFVIAFVIRSSRSRPIYA